jgi:hypothetical protein
MRQSIFDSIGNLDTLIAVIVGAMLATLGALFAELIQDKLNRKRRERDAARFFGEILASIDRILDFAFHTQTIGDEWGSVSQRLFRMAMRESTVYERNRERLFDIHDAHLRERIHAHFLTETFPIEAVITSCEQIDAIQSSETAHSKQTKIRLEELMNGRKRALEALYREKARTGEICEALEKIAGVKFHNFESSPPVAQRAADWQGNSADGSADEEQGQAPQ